MKALCSVVLEKSLVKSERKSARIFGPCAASGSLVFLGDYLFDCRYYIPIKNIERIFKRVALSKGGFTGRGIFGSIAYVVVQFEGGREYQCSFKREEDIDSMIAYVHAGHRNIPTHSKEAEKKLARKQREKQKRRSRALSDSEKLELQKINAAREFLLDFEGQTTELSLASKAKRVNERTNPSYKWVALAFVLMGIAALSYGIATVFQNDNGGIYYALIGFALILFFSGTNVRAAFKNNKRAVEARLSAATSEMEKIIAGFEGFPLPARYAHPVALEMMADFVQEGRAKNTAEALERLKEYLKSCDASVQVEQEEYDRIMAVKPMFLLYGYQ